MEQEPESSLSPKSSVNSVLKKELCADTWVQCDNPQCLKWRRVLPSAADGLQDKGPWYCFMNRHDQFNMCEEPQEDYSEYERLAKKCKLKYVASALVEGTLAWARMAGFCKWPALITTDVNSGSHVCCDHDGHVHSYHVEFLGERHSHGWISHRHVQVYGTLGKENDSSYMKRHKKTKGPYKRELSRYKGMSVEFAEQEANEMLELLPHDRLEKCVFRNKTTDAASVRDEVSQAERFNNEMRKSSMSSMLKRRKGLFKKMSSKTDNCRKSEDAKSKDEKDVASQSKRGGGGITSPDWLMSAKNLSQKLNESASLQGRTKEEKYALDLDMYVKNQARFERNLRAFMCDQGLRLSRAPCWKNVPVSFFQFFVTVHEHGGYEKVSFNRQWVHVYKELTNSAISSACAVKKFYRKNLLPYELHLTGQDYSDVIAEIRRVFPSQVRGGRRKKQSKANTKTVTQTSYCKSDSEKRDDQTKVTTQVTQKKSGQCKAADLLQLVTVSDGHMDTDNDKVGSQTQSSCVSSDTRHILARLDETGRQLTYSMLEEDVKKDSEKMDLNICFYNDSFNMKYADRLKECGLECNSKQEAGPQVVLEVSEACSSSEDTQDQTLNQMVSLGEELDSLHKQMIQDWQDPEH